MIMPNIQWKPIYIPNKTRNGFHEQRTEASARAFPNEIGRMSFKECKPLDAHVVTQGLVMSVWNIDRQEDSFWTRYKAK
jgi:hypothetical protein